MPAHEYTTVGHVTIDVLPDGTRQPGGTAFYSALQAARLGLRARIVTQGEPDEIERMLAPYREGLGGRTGGEAIGDGTPAVNYGGSLDLTIVPAGHTTALQTGNHGGERRQRVLAWAGEIAPPDVDTAILHLAPVARETPRSWCGRAEFVGLTPQGLVREWDASGEIALAALRPELLPQRSDAWVLHEREHVPCAAQLAEAVARGAAAAITDGPRPVTVYQPGAVPPEEVEPLRVAVPALPNAADDLGAGDVFAAAFFISLFEHQPAVQAAVFAAAAAAVRVGGAGPGAIGDRVAIEALLHSR